MKEDMRPKRSKELAEEVVDDFCSWSVVREAMVCGRGGWFLENFGLEFCGLVASDDLSGGKPPVFVPLRTTNKS